MPTLYRKHRPQTFSEVVGQNHIKITLQHEIETNDLAHAYLFAGPRGTGKTTMARILAKAVNCLNRKEGQAEPCNKCDSCLAIANNQSLDVVEIDAASHTGVDNVRENIISNARIAPSQNKYKVFIIDEVHMLSISAFNALLKIIEEPPANVIFILCTTEAHKVPTTIISRCQRFDFKKIGLNNIVARLERIAEAEKIKIDKEVLTEIARHSEGHLRDAESLLGQIISISEGQITAKDAALVIPRSDIQAIIKLIKYLGKKDTARAIRLVNQLVEEGVDLKVFLSNLVEVMRKMMLAKLDISLAHQFSWEWGEAVEAQISELNDLFTVDSLAGAIEEFNQALLKLKEAFLVQLPVELALVKLTTSNFASSPAKKTKTEGSAVDLKNFAKTNQEPNSKALPQAKNNSSFEPKPEKKVLGSVDLVDIVSRWDEVLAKITKYNHSLSLILRVCQPRQLQGNRLYLAFKYKFHKERIDKPAVKALVQKALGEVFGFGFEVEAEVDETLELGNGESSKEVVSADAGAKGREGGKGVEGDKREEGDNKETKEMIDNLLKTFGGRVVE